MASHGGISNCMDGYIYIARGKFDAQWNMISCSMARRIYHRLYIYSSFEALDMQHLGPNGYKGLDDRLDNLDGG